MRGAAKKVVSAPSRREGVRHMTIQGLCERQALGVVPMSASSFRYQPAPDRNIALRGQIVTLAQRYGAGMIYLKLRQRKQGAGHGSPAPGKTAGPERGLVDGFRLRPQR